MIKLLKTISDIIWVITTFLILYVGLFYTIKLKLPQFKLTNVFKKNEGNEKSNTLKLLSLTLAGKIGVGSIAGIALCIFQGGKATIFWLWISSIILASLTYVETKLSIKYRSKENNRYVGGPSFYIEKGLNNKKLAKAYAFLIILAYVLAFISVQINTIVKQMEMTFNFSELSIAIFLVVITYFSLKKGVDSISNLTAFLVPVMGGIYICIGIYVITNNFDQTLVVLKEIVTEAFDIEGLKGAILIPIIIGIERGVFSSESGIGTTAMITALSNNNDVEKEAKLQVLATFFTSLVICTITALIILTTSYQNINFTDINGIEVVTYAFYKHLGPIGIIILTIVIFLFAFSTIVTCFYYGEASLKYLTSKNTNYLKWIIIAIMIYSSFSSPVVIWNITDIIIAMIAIINVYTMYKLKDKI